jgi:hypothetical protein
MSKAIALQVGLVVLVLAMVVGCANDPTTQLAGGEALEQDAAAYAEDMGVSREEAVRRLALQPDVGELQVLLAENEGEVFGGLWIEHDPEFRVVIAVTRDERRIHRQYVAGSVLDGVVVMQQVQATWAELEALQTRVTRDLAEIGSRPDSAIRVQDNCVELFVADLQAFEAKLVAADTALPEHVCVTDVGPYAEAPPLELPPGLAFARQEPPEGMLVEMSALMIGRLVESEGCLRVVADGGDAAGYLVIWPYDHSVGVEADGTIAIRDGDGVTVARVGDQVQIGGGETPSLGSSSVIEGAGGCEGPYWIAARGIESSAPEVSEAPDKVAYIVNGDVWIRTLPEGAPQRLTDDGLNSHPVWSPSGRYVAFLKDIELWTVDTVDGTGWPWASPVATFAWSPVDDRLAYVSGSGILRMMVADPATLTDRAVIPPEVGAQGMIGRLAWSPDGQAIAYAWQQGREHQSLRWVPVEGGESSELYVSGVPERGEAVPVGWASEEALLFLQGELLSASLLMDGAPLYAVSVADGAVKPLADRVLTHVDFVVPAGDGSAIAVVVGAGRGTWSNKRLDVVDGVTGDAVTLSLQDQAATSPQAASSPAWSPDGTRLAYAAMADRGDLVGGNTAREGLATRRIWIADTAGGEPLRVTDDPAFRDERPLWSGDGSSLLFVRMDADEGVSLWWLDLAAGGPMRVVDALGPLPGPAEAWFGTYGHIDWAAIFDVWTPAR